MRIGLIVDNPQRDLHGLALVAWYLILDGHLVYLVPMYTQAADVALLNLDRVLVNYVRRNNLHLLKAYKAMGVGVYVLDTEGGLLSKQGPRSPESWAKFAADQALGDLIEGYCFWGPLLRDAFRRHSRIHGSKLHLTGQPRYDLCHPGWRMFAKNGDTDYVLINTNFATVNPYFGRSAHTERMTLLSAGFDHSYIERFFQEMEELFPRYLDAVSALANRLRDRKIVVRPHPFEDPEVYRRELRDLQNVEVQVGGNVLQAIAGARCTVHLNCGTAVETLMAGRLPISLEFLNSQFLRNHGNLPSTISYRAQNIDEVVAAIEDPCAYLHRIDADNTLRENVVPWFYEADGYASARVAEVVGGNGAWATGRAKRIGRRLTCFGYRQRALVIMAWMTGSKAVEDLRGMLRSRRRRKAIDSESVMHLMARIRSHQAGSISLKVGAARSPLSGCPMGAIQIRAGDWGHVNATASEESGRRLLWSSSVGHRRTVRSSWGE